VSECKPLPPGVAPLQSQPVIIHDCDPTNGGGCRLLANLTLATLGGYRVTVKVGWCRFETRVESAWFSA